MKNLKKLFFLKFLQDRKHFYVNFHFHFFHSLFSCNFIIIVDGVALNLGGGWKKGKKWKISDGKMFWEEKFDAIRMT